MDMTDSLFAHHFDMSKSERQTVSIDVDEALEINVGGCMVGNPQRTLDLDRSVGVLINFLSNRMTSTGSAVYRSRFGLAIGEFRLLVMLACEPDISPARICQVMGLDNGAVSRALRALERRKLVVSRPDPRNPAYRMWSLTEQGAELQDKAVQVAMERDAILMADIAEDEHELLLSMLRRMLARVDALRTPV
jgi:DNA-binding MarR family transcriptional regulator